MSYFHLPTRKCFLLQNMYLVRDLRLCKKTLAMTSKRTTFSLLPPPLIGIALGHHSNQLNYFTLQSIRLFHYSCNATSSRLLVSLLLRRPRHPVNERVLTIPHLMEIRRRSSNTPMTRTQRRSDGDHLRRSRRNPSHQTKTSPAWEESSRYI